MIINERGKWIFKPVGQIIMDLRHNWCYCLHYTRNRVHARAGQVQMDPCMNPVSGVDVWHNTKKLCRRSICRLSEAQQGEIKK